MKTNQNPGLHAEMITGDFDGTNINTLKSYHSGVLDSMATYGEHLIETGFCNSYLIGTELNPLQLNFINQSVRRDFATLKAKLFIKPSKQMRYQILIYGIASPQYAKTLKEAFVIISEMEQRDSAFDEYTIDAYSILNLKTNNISIF